MYNEYLKPYKCALIDYHYYFISFVFFTPVLGDGLSLESEWQQVSSGLQDTSQYSGRS